MKSISVDQQAALRLAHARPMLFVEIDWSSGVQNYVTAGASVAWDSKTWNAIGNLVAIGDIEETEEIVATGLTLTLSGVPESLLSLALTEHIQGRRVTMWLGLLDESYALIGTPVKEFEGRCDVLAYDQAEDGTSTLTLTVESRYASLLGASLRRYTHEDQQHAYPGDEFFKFLASMNERAIIFPSAQAQGRR